MKNTGRIILLIALMSTALLSCTKNEQVAKLTLKQAVDQSALHLNTAVEEITATKAFSILTVNDGGLKSGNSLDSFKVYIPLDQIKGEYAYKPARKVDHMGRSIMRFFERTADNSEMIVRMPMSKVTNPRSLRRYAAADTALINNFAIAVSDYHNNYNNYHDFDYVLASAISVDNVAAGNLNINSLVSPKDGIHYTSQYVFNGSYTAGYKYDSGDTTVSSFSITGGDKVLYEEKLLTIKQDTLRFGREHQYILTIGDVQIVRKTSAQTTEVYVNGVIQPNATVTIIDKEDDDEASVCSKRDIQITVEDGTTTTVSALIGESIADIKTLFDSLHQVYFAAYVVDWIAYDIYYQRN